MSVLVGSARYDENGSASGGTAGDQNGKEVSTQAWYSKPWDYMAIHPDANVREKIAAAVEDACANDCIGYDQNQRNTLNTQAAKVDYKLSKITTACECDCSSLVNVACIAAGAVTDSSYGSNGWTTSTMKDKLKAAGFVILTDYLTAEKYAVRGAIYVKSGSHTVTALGNGSSYESTLEKAGLSASSSNDSASGSATSGFAAGDKVTLSNTPIYSSSTAKESSGKKSGTYYIWNKKTTNGRIRITNKAENVGASGQVTGWVNVSDICGTASTGPTGAKSDVAGTYTVKPANGLNIRKDAGMTKAKIIAIPKGTKVNCDGTYKTSGGVKWLYVTFTYNGKSYAGYACSTYLSKC